MNKFAVSKSKEIRTEKLLLWTVAWQNMRMLQECICAHAHLRNRETTDQTRTKAQGVWALCSGVCAVAVLPAVLPVCSLNLAFGEAIDITVYLWWGLDDGGVRLAHAADKKGRRYDLYELQRPAYYVANTTLYGWGTNGPLNLWTVRTTVVLCQRIYTWIGGKCRKLMVVLAW